MIESLCPHFIPLLGLRGGLKCEKEPVQLMPESAAKSRAIRTLLMAPLPITKLTSTLLLLLELHFLRTIHKKSVCRGVTLDCGSKCGMGSGIASPNSLLRPFFESLNLLQKKLNVERTQLLRLTGERGRKY